ncbi:hypothetical protein JW992_12625, partial [candidate division KSB1 bacterium]|nr:hypothetical protein [candidate division KSB1 bacterium]
VASTLTETTGDGDGVFEPGEQADLVIHLANSGVSIGPVTAHLTCPTDDIEVLDGEAVFERLALNDTASNDAAPFRLQAAVNPNINFVPLRLSLSAENFSMTLDLSVPVGEPTVLLIDDDCGADYESHYARMSEQADWLYRIWSVRELGVALLDELMKYDAVVWFTGDDHDSTLTLTEQMLIRSYLDSGGRLLLTGQNIGFDLVADGTESDSLFFAEVLHAQFIADVTENYTVLGVNGDPIVDRVSVRFTGQYPQAENQVSQSVIAPIAPAVTLMHYIPSFLGAAIRCENPENGSRWVYLAFGMEGIAGLQSTSAADLLDRILSWLRLYSTSVQKNSTVMPQEFLLTQNYPNPFNPETRIALQLPEPARVKARVVNVLGQEIRLLFDRRLDSGVHTLHWDGRDDAGSAVGAGVYWLSVRMEGESGAAQSGAVKMVLMP